MECPECKRAELKFSPLLQKYYCPECKGLFKLVEWLGQMFRVGRVSSDDEV